MSKISEIVEKPYQDMLDELREVYGSEIDAHIEQVLEKTIHESYQELQAEQQP